MLGLPLIYSYRLFTAHLRRKTQKTKFSIKKLPKNGKSDHKFSFKALNQFLRKFLTNFFLSLRIFIGILLVIDIFFQKLHVKLQWTFPMQKKNTGCYTEFMLHCSLCFSKNPFVKKIVFTPMQARIHGGDGVMGVIKKGQQLISIKSVIFTLTCVITTRLSVSFTRWV
jgi:hypothetical protein